MSKRVLIYNWAEFDDSNGRGGGVSVFLQNLIPELVAHGHQVFFVSAGCHYSIIRQKIFTQEYANIFSHLGVKSYRIWNSPVKAPGQDSFYELKQCLDEPTIAEHFINLLTQIGGVDEIHFHGFEGISTRVLVDIKQAELAKQTFVWFHNYHVVCAQMNLFRVKDRINCEGFDNGRDCVQCLQRPRNQVKLKKIQALISSIELSSIGDSYLAGLVLSSAKRGYRAIRELAQKVRGASAENGVVTDILVDATRPASDYVEWRLRNVDRLNNYVDHCFAVSALARERLLGFGLPKDKTSVVPLGMDVHAPLSEIKSRAHRKKRGAPLRIAFLGNGLPEKGLYFMLEALAQCPNSLRQDIELSIYAKLDEAQIKRVKRLYPHDIHLFAEGYSRLSIPEICGEIDLVIVPTLCWETFNQVAYEVTMCGVPVLYSDSIGVSGFLSPMLSFSAGDQCSFVRLIERVIESGAMLSESWSTIDKEFPSMGDTLAHINQKF